MPLPVLGYLRMDSLPDPGPRWLARLPAGYRQRLAAMGSDAVRRQTLAGLGLLEEAGRHAGCTIALERLERSPNGQPLIQGGPVFSISHSGEVCVCLLAAGGWVGVDVERVRPLRSHRILRLLAPWERAMASREPRVFFASWTAREATVKATGWVGPRRIAQVRLARDRAEIDARRFYLQRPVLDGAYALCVASSLPLEALVPYDLTESVRKYSAA